MEYAGYVQGYKPLDWSKKTGEVAQNLRKIEAGREEKREKLDKLYSDNSKLIGDVELGLDPSFDNVILNQTMEAKRMVYDAYKKMRRNEISPRQYKIMMQNMSSGIGELSNAVKNKNKRFAEAEKLQLEGKLGGRSTYINELISEMSTFKDYKPMWSDTGHLAIGKIDPDTGKVIGGSVMPVGALNIEQNIINKKFDVDARAYEYAKRIGKFQITKDGRIIGGRKAMEDWEKTKNSIISEMYSEPTDAGDALVDSGDGYYFYTEGDGQEVTDKAVKLIKRSDKKYVAELTDSQEQAARELAAESLDRQVGFTDKKIKSDISASDRERYAKSRKEATANMEAYKMAKDALRGNNLAVLETGDIEEAKYTDNGVFLTIKGEEIGPITDEVQMVKYIMNEKDATKAKRIFDAGREEYISQFDTEYTPEEGQKTYEEYDDDIALLESDVKTLTGQAKKDAEAKLKEKRSDIAKIMEKDYDTSSADVNEAIQTKVKDLLDSAGLDGASIKKTITAKEGRLGTTILQLKVGDGDTQTLSVDFDVIDDPETEEIRAFSEAMTKAVNSHIRKINPKKNRMKGF